MFLIMLIKYQEKKIAVRHIDPFLKGLSSTGCHAKNIYKHNPLLTSCYLALLMCMWDRALRISLHSLSLPSGVVSNDAYPLTLQNPLLPIKTGPRQKLIPQLQFAANPALIELQDDTSASCLVASLIRELVSSLKLKCSSPLAMRSREGSGCSRAVAVG